MRVVIYEDLQCSDCADFERMVDEQLIPKYGRQVEFEHRDFPLPKHTWARQAAVAARFLESKSPGLALAYRRHTMLAPSFDGALDAFCQSRGIDPAEARAALANPEFAESVERDYQEGLARGVSKTPTVFVNEAVFMERFSVEDISKALDEALSR